MWGKDWACTVVMSVYCITSAIARLDSTLMGSASNLSAVMKDFVSLPTLFTLATPPPSPKSKTVEVGALAATGMVDEEEEDDDEEEEDDDDDEEEEGGRWGWG